MNINPVIQLYKALNLDIENNNKEVTQSKGLLAPKKPMSQQMTDKNKAREPLNVVLQHMNIIRNKRKEIKDGA
jgi:phytoene/squalene synthetase